MKYSIKKNYNHLFEDTSILHNLAHNLETSALHNLTHNSDTTDNSEYTKAKALIKSLEDKVNILLNTSFNYFSIKLKFDDKDNADQTQFAKIMYNEIINYTYFLLIENEISLDGIDSVLKENVVNKKALVKESNLQQTNIDNFLQLYFNVKSEGKTKVVTKLMSASNLQEFKAYLFYFLFKNLVDKKANLELITQANINESVSAIVNFFTKKLKSKQSSLTVHFGAFFEEVFREQIYEYLKIKKHFKLSLKHMSKKLAIVLLYCCNNIFENKENDQRYSHVFDKINKGEKPDESDYLKDFINIEYEGSKGKNFVKQEVGKIINNFSQILKINNLNNIYCDDFEKDTHFKSLAETNSPFDFIIREKDIETSDKNIGLFDLKASNQGSTSSPLSKGATGNNGGTQNSALTFVNSMTEKIKELNSNDIGISFFGLIQMNFTLDFTHKNNYEISIHGLQHKISPALTSALYSIDKDHFYLSDSENKKISSFNTKLKSNITLTPDIINNINNLTINSLLNFESRKKEKVTNAISDILEKYKSLGDNILNAFSNQDKLLVSNFEFILNPNNYEAIWSLKNDKIVKIQNNYNIIIDDDKKEIIKKIKKDNLFDPLSFAKLILNFFKSTSISEQEKIDIEIFKVQYSSWGPSVRGNKSKAMTKLILTVFDEENAYENGNVLRKKLGISPILEKYKKKADNIYLTNFQTSYVKEKLSLDGNEDKKARASINTNAFNEVKKIILDQIKNNIDIVKIRRRYAIGGQPYSISDVESEEYFSQQNKFDISKSIRGIVDHKKRRGKSLKEVYSHLFKKKVINEGGLAGHMMHPYEALDMTPKQIKDRIKKYSTSQKIIEKVDGQNLFFTVEEDGTLMFARNKEDMTHDDLVEKFTNHPAEVPFVSGGNAIKRGVDQWLSSAGAFGQQEILEIFHPDGEARSFINFEIMHKDHPNQLEYGENFIVFHSIVDFIDGREAVYSSNNSQRLNKLISLMKPGIESSDYTLASNRTVDLNSLTNVQISDYISRINSVMQELDITDNEYLGDGVEKQIKKEIEAEGVTISDDAIKMLYDFALYGEDRLGNSIKSKDFTSLMDPKDVKKLRSIGLTNANKAAAKVRSILSPFKDIFVDLGIDLLDGVASSYMSMEIDLGNIDKLRDKLQTAIDDLRVYMSNMPEEEWEPTVKRLKPHYDKVEKTGVFDTVSTSVEGGVYDHEGDLLKVTGGFAPLNQILGAAYRDKKGIFPTFKQKFMQQESIRRSLKSVFDLIY